MRSCLLLVAAALVAAPVQAASDREVEEAMEAARRALEAVGGEMEVQFTGERPFRFEGRGRRAMIGISLVDQEDDAHSDEGVYVAAVSPGGPADEAGIQSGDLITRVDDTPLDGRGEETPERILVEYLSALEPGDEVELVFERDGDEERVMLETEAMGPQVYSFGNMPRGFSFRGDGGVIVAPDGDRMIQLRMGGPWGDMELVTLSEDLGRYFGTASGILVVRAPRDDAFQLRDGDVIKEIGGREPRDPSHAMRILRSYMAGEELEITIYRDQREQELEIEVPDLRDRYEDILIPD